MQVGAARWEEVGGRPRWAAGGDAELQEIFSDVSCQWLCRKFGFRRGSERAKHPTCENIDASWVLVLLSQVFLQLSVRTVF